MGNEGEKTRGAIFTDIRRYYCEYCGICRSKKALIASHILAHHEEELKAKEQSDEQGHGKKLNICEECGASFQKPAHLKQHMQSHSLERPFTCPVDDCHSSYRRKDHLTRHMLQHQGKLFECPVEDCKSRFTIQLSWIQWRPSVLNQALKKNIKRHMRMHEGVSSERIKCSVEGCSLTFSTTSNLNQHIKAVHMELKPFKCSIPGCHMRFAFKHVRDNHEKSGCHVYTPGDFVESDEQFRSRPRGGRKRKYPVIETLMRKRIVPPSESDLVMNQGDEYPSWIHSAESVL
ncbi:UNVERIFIED_CONTAM: Transcription factor IIIA [Sesamum radiatum]|uniref:Transcription factor IIIA n=1 Tax=Sesamum radiatum TaxID=300843 RepID=A0AAW2LCD8_SESRA